MRPNESFVNQPIRSLQTMLRVLAEDDRTLPTVVPDGIYGQETITAVSAFQRSVGLPVTGITNQETWEAVVEAYEPALVRVDKATPIEIIIDPGKVYRQGETSANIYLLQAMLAFLSRYHTDIGTPGNDGVLDSPTSDALAAFQLLAGLPPTGELDKISWQYLVNQFTLNANLRERQ